MITESLFCAVHLKLTQYCKSTIPQYKAMTKFKEINKSIQSFWLLYGKWMEEKQVQKWKDEHMSLET